MTRRSITLVAGIVLLMASVAASANDVVQVQARIVSDGVDAICEDGRSPDGAHWLKCRYRTTIELMLANKPVLTDVYHPAHEKVSDIWIATGDHIVMTVPKVTHVGILAGQSPAVLKAEELNIVERKTTPINVTEAKQARQVLINFFSYLHSGKFDQAVHLFDAWDGMAVFSPWEERNDKSKILANYCKGMGTCLRLEVLEVREVAEGQYMFRVKFMNDDGTEVVLGNCCNAPDLPEHDEAASGVQPWRPYYVHKVNERYFVRTPPIYVP